MLYHPMMKRFGVLVFLVACTKANPAATCPDGICIDPAHAFCDVDGTFTNQPGTCVAVSCTPGEFGACRGDSALVCNAQGNSYDTQPCEKGCDSQIGCKPFCTPNAAISCVADTLTTCSATGTSSIVTTCALGCAAGETRCRTFTPSNGLGPALLASASAADVVLPAGSRIDTDTGVVQDVDGTPIAVKSELVDQVGAPQIRVLEAKSFMIAGVNAVGTKALAFVSDGAIVVTGKLDARGHGTVGGPGSVTSGACVGVPAQQNVTSCGQPNSFGAPGAGAFQSGGTGGATNGALAPGGPITGFSPLVGGCSGGAQLAPNGTTVVARGGGGGAGVQLVSATRIALSDGGLISIGAGGGASTTGGGSGGTAILEAPEVSIIGPAAGVVANGGAGGGCNTTGPDGPESTAAAPGAMCPNYFAGNGGTGSLAPGNGCRAGVDSCVASCPITYGGGGGSVGRLHIVTKDATYGTSGAPLFSVAISTSTLIVH